MTCRRHLPNGLPHAPVPRIVSMRDYKGLAEAQRSRADHISEIAATVIVVGAIVAIAIAVMVDWDRIIEAVRAAA